MEKTTLYLPEELALRLRQEARRSGRSQAQMIREAIREYLDRQPKPMPGSIGMGEDSELSGKDTEDWHPAALS